MEHFDVIIVGAGISGIGTAYHLQRDCPGKTYAILEGRDAVGGTWDIFRYPGIRSDSDMHTMGYSFKPWIGDKAIADGPSILAYVNETAAENKITDHIRFNHRVRSASWSSKEAQWTVGTENHGSLTCNFLMMCSGYFSYESGYTPKFEGIEEYHGTVIHPQHWPESFDYRGKRVIVIGSGATAMTLIPSMAADAEHITMLQRSPSYVVARPDRDAIANWLRKLLPDRLAYALTRFKNTQLQHRVYKRTRVAPEKIKQKLIELVRKALPANYDIEKHFTPSYNPWDQRLCLLPNGDLFEAIKRGKASVVTDTIDRFSETGIQLKSGEKLEADVIVTATGLNLKLLGGAQFSVDGETVNLTGTYSYKGMMYSDVPNLIQTFGYINASWTLRADLTAEYACRLINRMDELGSSQCTPRLREEDADMPRRNWIEDFTPGYMQRKMHLFPKQGDREPWLNTQDYSRDKKMIRKAPLEDGVLQFSPRSELWSNQA